VGWLNQNWKVTNFKISAGPLALMGNGVSGPTSVFSTYAPGDACVIWKALKGFELPTNRANDIFKQRFNASSLSRMTSEINLRHIKGSPRKRIASDPKVATTKSWSTSETWDYKPSLTLLKQT
jgi:hypothetical protein